MACQSSNAEIKGHTVFARQWPASKAMAMQLKLLNVMGIDAIPFIEGIAEFKHILRLSQIPNKTTEEILEVIKEFIFCARMDGKEITPATFDIEFSGDLMLAYKIFGFVCEVQYKDFFAQGQETQEAKKSQVENSSAKQSTGEED